MPNFVVSKKPINRDKLNHMTSIAKRLSALTATLVAVGATCQGAPQAAGENNTPERTKAYMVADAHLDTQWNWDIQTTIKEYVWNTINQNLFLLKKFPNYVFNFEGGVKYAWMKEYYPREYEEMKDYIKNGRWHISGASWDATDAIVPSTESAIRNIMLGQQFYRNEFGVESTDIFLPDCFGFGWTLPTVANHCGLIGFSSQKLGWRVHPFYDGDRRYPFTIGLWHGVDGATIMMAHGYDYGRRWDLEDLSHNESLQKNATETPLNMVYRYYGTGDIGGSPTITSVAAVERGIKGNGPVEIVSATSDQVFKDFLPYDKHPELPVHDGELLMDVHGTGCYTSQAAMKLYNRQNEQLGDAAERAAVGAELLGLMEYPSDKLTTAWQRFIFHQFHDDLTGTSIPRAYEFSWNDELLSLKDFSGTVTQAVGAVASKMDTRVKGTPVVLFNALGTPVTDFVEMNIPAKRLPKTAEVYDASGKKTTAQVLGFENGNARILAAATVPANGYAVYDVRLSGNGTNAPINNSGTFENSLYRLTFDRNGDITSLYDKANSRELVKDGKAIRLALFTENESFAWPAWEIIKDAIDAEPQSITENVEMAMVEDGPLRKTLRISKTHGDSRFTQYVRLHEGTLADRIDFYNEVDWLSTNSLLKAEFPLALDNEMATYDLGIGAVKRGNNTKTAYEVYAQQWADLTDSSDSYGVTVMNDCKYGWDKPDNNTLRLTLLHTPKTKGGYAYQDRQDFGHHTFTYSLRPHAGALAKAETCREAELLNQRVKPFITAKHAGELGREFSLASIDNGNVAIKALKKAENSDEYVVRVYETGGKDAQNARLTFASDIAQAAEADGTEKTIGNADFSGNTLNLTIKPNGVKTFKVKLNRKATEAIDHMPLQLDFDKRCFSWNQFASDGDFEGGYSYAAELVPAELKVGNVPFKLENKELLNGMKCEGDTLRLPEGHKFNRLYLLAAAAKDGSSVKCDVRAGNNTTTLTVPSYTGFIGQWGHEGHTTGYLTDAEVAYAGTHRHSADGDCPYEFTYMFSFPVDIPAKATEIILPDNPEVVIFAATATNDDNGATVAANDLFRTSIISGRTEPDLTASNFNNILKPEHIIGWTGFVNDKEHPTMLVDGDETTKWCDTSGVPSYVDFDLGEPTEINSWKVVNAARENIAYVTSSCLLQGRNATDEEWRTLDFFTGNKRNIVTKRLETPQNVRYLRLNVIQPVQGADGRNARIYEFGVSK